MSYIFTSESVSEGHPDKLCDRVSDTVLDLFLKHEPEARVACETLATTNRVVLAGEVRASESTLTQIMAEIEPAVRAAVKDIGYEQDASFITPISNFKTTFMNNRPISRWVLIQAIIKMKALAIRGLCLVMPVMKPMS
jgi:S-adenosylmethionine synthetase